MKKIFGLLMVMIILSFSIAQKPALIKVTANGKTPKVTKVKGNKLVLTDEIYMPVELKNEDGSKSQYFIKKGDKLVYHVTAFATEYDFIVTVNAGSSAKPIDFNYEMTNTKKTTGHVIISMDARKNAKKYVNYFGGGEMNLSDASTVWVTDANFKELDYSKTTMSFDGGDEETLFAEGKNEVNPVVKIKGKDKKLNAFSITNAQGSQGDKTLWINNSNLNPLIVKMELGFTIELKEIR